MSKKQLFPLPIDTHLPDIAQKLAQYSIVFIKASPGSGKTTRLPWFLANRSSGKVIVLEPRRIAAKLAARRVADENGLELGKEVGYQFRFEKKLTDSSKLIFYTEGTFLRVLKDPNFIKQIEVVILDEFHERHLETDLALAFLSHYAKNNPNLKIVIMSATLDPKIYQQFDRATLIEIEAPLYPVSIHYLPNVPSELNRPMEQKIRLALDQIAPSSDTLVFLPGMREILKVQNYLQDQYGKICVLHSEVSQERQQEALLPSAERKIILSTNIAESSVTIPGIKAVIDLGIERDAHYSPWNGLKVIMDSPSTQASAEQRAGRAGRTSAGDCYRLYSLQNYQQRPPFSPPEILTSDLTDLYLTSLAFTQELNWPTPPPKDRWSKAQDLCFMLGLIDQNQQVTPMGLKAQQMPIDLRLARAIMAGFELNTESRKKLLHYICEEIEDDFSGKIFQRMNSIYPFQAGNESHWEKSLLMGFVDQVAQYRPNSHDFVHYSGKVIKAHKSLEIHQRFYLILNITQRQEAIQVVPIEEEWFYEIKPFPLKEENEFSISDDFKQTSLVKIGSITLEKQEKPILWSSLNPEDKKKVLQLAQTPYQKRWETWKCTNTFGRYHFWSKISNQIISEEEMLNRMEDYFRDLDLLKWDMLDSYYDTSLKEKLAAKDLDRHLPLTLNFGGKKPMNIIYSEHYDPFVEAPIQDFYGLKHTPLISGKYPLTLKLLGPHNRPIQVTKDLENFWSKTYQDMKKELSREYPKHYWPDDPSTAQPFLLKSHLPKG